MKTEPGSIKSKDKPSTKASSETSQQEDALEQREDFSCSYDGDNEYDDISRFIDNQLDDLTGRDKNVGFDLPLLPDKGPSPSYESTVQSSSTVDNSYGYTKQRHSPQSDGIDEHIESAFRSVLHFLNLEATGMALGCIADDTATLGEDDVSLLSENSGDARVKAKELMNDIIPQVSNDSNHFDKNGNRIIGVDELVMVDIGISFNNILREFHLNEEEIDRDGETKKEESEQQGFSVVNAIRACREEYHLMDTEPEKKKASLLALTKGKGRTKGVKKPSLLDRELTLEAESKDSLEKTLDRIEC